VNTDGLIVASGFDTSGTGPGSNLHLLTINMSADRDGTSQIGITVNDLADDDTNTIGNPNGIGGTVNVGPGETATPTPGTVTETPTPVVTETPTPGSGTGCTCDSGCSSVQNITTDFTQNGSGTYCFFIPCVGSYINSWNLTTLEVNGQDFTNSWVSASSLPATIDGGYYIYYVGNYGWAHFEAVGACSGTVTETPTPVVTETPTPVVTETPTPGETAPPGVGDVSMSPSSLNVTAGENFSFQIRVNSGTQKVAAYGLDITYNANILSIGSDDDVVEGSDGFVSAVNVNTAGLIVASGFDTSGTGPGSNLHLLTINMSAISDGTSQIGITVNDLADDDTNTIGNPNGIGGTVNVGPGETATPTPVVTETPTPVVTETPTPTPTSEYPEWSSSQFYRQGDMVTYEGVVYECITWWSWGQVPPDNPSSWEPVGAGPTETPAPVVTETPTPVVTETPTPVTVTETPPPLGVGDVSMNPSEVSAQLGQTASFEIRVNSGNQRVAAYGIDITYDSNLLSVTEDDVVEGADGFISAVNVNDPGIIRASGFDTSGEGPGDNLHLLTVNMATLALGTSNIGISVDSLADEDTNTIGNPNGIGGTIIITEGVTATPTPVVTETPTPVVTETPTPVVTETPTPVVTETPTPVVTETPTPVVTETPTPVVTETPTPVVTETPTPVVTETPTPVVTETPTPTPAQKTAGSVWIDPESQSVSMGSSVVFEVHVHTGSQDIAAYGIDIYYDSAILSINSDDDVEEGADGFIAAVNVNTDGKIVTSGFDTGGEGPGTDLHLLTITMQANGRGTSALDLDVRSLADSDTNTIGTPDGISGSITVN
jgi:hypothetical protein